LLSYGRRGVLNESLFAGIVRVASKNAISSNASGGDRPARAYVPIECFFLPPPYFFQTFSRQNFVARIDCDSRSNRRAGRYTTETDERLRETGPLSIARNRFELKTQTGRVSAAKNVACQIYIPADRLRDNGL
jgi:hypothetical protein